MNTRDIVTQFVRERMANKAGQSLDFRKNDRKLTRRANHPYRPYQIAMFRA